MIYFLDFDRTLFDTDAFLKELPDAPGCAPFRDELIAVIEGTGDTLSMDKGRQEVWQKITEAITSGALTFLPGELERFLYADTTEFLRAMGNEAIIITFGELNRQKLKVESALANVVRVTVLYTEDKIKAEYLADWPGYYGQPAVYADDRPHELEAMASAYPALRVFEMRRDGAPGDGRWPVVRSLAELP